MVRLCGPSVLFDLFYFPHKARIIRLESDNDKFGTNLLSSKKPRLARCFGIPL
jgi:hypothetical protein